MADWDELVVLTLDEFRRLAADSMPVLRRLRAVLVDLLGVAPRFRRRSLERQIALLDEAAEAGFKTDFERDLAKCAEVRGTGT